MLGLNGNNDFLILVVENARNGGNQGTYLWTQRVKRDERSIEFLLPALFFVIAENYAAVLRTDKRK